MVLAWIDDNGKGAFVCRLPLGARKCASSLTLKPRGGDDFFGTAEVFTTGGADVSIALYDCCTIGVNGIVVFNSTDGGSTFGPFAQAGDLPGLATGVGIGSQLVLSPADNSSGLQIQAVAAKPGSPQGAIANPVTGGNADTSLTRYKNGVLDTSVPILDSSGAGILLGSPGAGEPALAQPVLNPQHVTLKLARTKVPQGKTTTASAAAAPALTGQTVTLQRLSGKTWVNVSTAKEKSSGTFSFTVPSTTRSYRVVVAYKPGEYMYGYSNTVKVTQTK